MVKKYPPFAELYGSPLELEFRHNIRAILKFHNIIDGVIEADLVSAILGTIAETDPLAHKEFNDIVLLNKLNA